MLAWSHHVAKVCKSMSYYLYLLLKHRHVIKEDLLKTLTESLVLSHSLYCLPVWGPSLSHYSLQRLQRMHNRAVHLCKSLHKYNHVSHHYQSLNWLPFELLVQHRSLCAMNKLFKFQCIPLDPPIVFGRIHSHQTRTRVFFAQPVWCRFSFTQRYFRSSLVEICRKVCYEMLTNFVTILYNCVVLVVDTSREATEGIGRVS